MTATLTKLSDKATDWTALDGPALHAKHNEIAREMQRLAAIPVDDRGGEWYEDADWALRQYDFSYDEHARRNIVISRATPAATPEALAKRAALGMLPGETLTDTLRRMITYPTA